MNTFIYYLAQYFIVYINKKSIQVCGGKMENENRKDSRKFVFGNERFGGSYTPGEFEFNFPEDMSREEFERMFARKMNSLHRRGNDFADEFFDFDTKSRKEKLKPLSIRVKPHTKDFYKNDSILTAREVLEIYENFNNGSEAFINSLLEDEKNLERELKEVQEKLHNARLFKEKLGEIEPESDVLTDEDKVLQLKRVYKNSEIKIIGNEISPGKAQNDILRDIQTYNTLVIRIFSKDGFLTIGVYTDTVPIVYYFKNEYSREDIEGISNCIEEHCAENDIEFIKVDRSCFEE